MTTENLRDTIEPKSTQINFDDLMDISMTIKVTKVSRGSSEQPVVINFEGDNGKPYLPGKSMRRVLIHAWGDDGRNWVGKSMTLYGDSSVKFGGVAVGGIRISHLSDINRTLEMALTTTRGKRSAYTVKQLKIEPPAAAIQSPATYPEDKFTAALKTMVEMVTSGKATLESVAAQCAKTAPLSAEQWTTLTGAVNAHTAPTETDEQF